ncbi:MAG: cupin domain-containing protein [Pseudolabrys sp.]|nr:cupin domain-containing protein [Pseudolabrys sp.]
MKQRLLQATVAMTLGLAGLAGAQERPQGYPLVPLFSTGTNIVGETIRYPTTGVAKVTAAIVTIAAGAKTITHEHGVPMFAYILDGELTVDYGTHGKRMYRKGDAFMEAISVEHFGVNPGTQPVRILVVYMGAEGSPPDTIPKN